MNKIIDYFQFSIQTHHTFITEELEGNLKKKSPKYRISVFT